MGQITSEFMRQVQRTSFDGFSEKTIRETKKALIDTIGCMLAGTRSPIGKATMEVFEGFGGQPESSVIGSKRKVPVAIAAYINAETCVGPDLSDNYQPESVILSHPGEAVIPAVLALGEKKGCTLRDLYTAVVVGYETAGRYALAIEPRRPEVYSFSTHYTLAAAVGCGKILGFSDEEMEKNLGMAGALASLPVTGQMWGFRKRPASWHRDMPGHSNFSAVIASQYIRAGFEGSRSLLDPETEFYKIAGSDHFNPDHLFKDWGKKYVIGELTFKQVPT